MDETTASAATAAELARCPGAPAVFLLVDAHQPGAAASRMARSPILPRLRAAKDWFLVVQSTSGVTEPGSALAELDTWLRKLELRPARVMVNSDDLRWSALADAVVRAGAAPETHGQEAKWLANMGYSSAADPATRLAADILRQHRDRQSPRVEP
jgi:hypothetical protein